MARQKTGAGFQTVEAVCEAVSEEGKGQVHFMDGDYRGRRCREFDAGNSPVTRAAAGIGYSNESATMRFSSLIRPRFLSIGLLAHRKTPGGLFSPAGEG